MTSKKPRNAGLFAGNSLGCIGPWTRSHDFAIALAFRLCRCLDDTVTRECIQGLEARPRCSIVNRLHVRRTVLSWDLGVDRSVLLYGLAPEIRSSLHVLANLRKPDDRGAGCHRGATELGVFPVSAWDILPDAVITLHRNQAPTLGDSFLRQKSQFKRVHTQAPLN